MVRADAPHVILRSLANAIQAHGGPRVSAQRLGQLVPEKFLKDRDFSAAIATKLAVDVGIPAHVILDALLPHVSDVHLSHDEIFLQAIQLQQTALANAKLTESAKRELDSRDIEAKLTKQLSECGFDTQKILRVCQSTVQEMGIPGVNVYLLNKKTGKLQSILRDEMAAASRYDAPQIPLAGEKKYFIDSNLGSLLLNRRNLPDDISSGDRIATQADYNADLERYFGKTGRTLEQGEALAENLFMRFRTDSNFDIIIQANNHKGNKARIDEIKAPKPLFTHERKWELFFDSAHRIGRLVANELGKAKLTHFAEIWAKRFKLLHELHINIDTENDPSALFIRVFKKLDDLFDQSPIGRASIMLWDADKEALTVAVHKDIDETKAKGIKVNRGEGVAGFVFDTGEVILSGDAPTHKMIKDRGKANETGAGSFMCVPIISGNERFGVINIRSKNNDAFGKEDLDFLKDIGSILGNALSRINSSKERELLIERLVELTHELKFDKKTGLLRRDPGEVRLQSICAEKLKLGTADKNIFNVSLLFLDIDYFKHVNDTLGHKAGDIVLTGVAKAAREYLAELKSQPGFDSLGIRWGGEELVFIIVNPKFRQASAIGEELLRRIKAAKFERTINGITEILKDDKGQDLHVTASIGVSHLEPNVRTNDDIVEIAEALVDNADDAVYAAKLEGRNRVVEYKAGMASSKKK